MVAAVLHSPVPTSSSRWRPGTTQHLGDLGVVGWKGNVKGGFSWLGGEIGVAGRPRLAPTCGEVCVRQSTEQMRALSPVIFHIFSVLNKTKTMQGG